MPFSNYLLNTTQIFMKKDVGRPRVPKATAKAPGISIRLSQDERKLIDRAIQLTGMSQSDWVRRILLSAAGARNSNS